MPAPGYRRQQGVNLKSKRLIYIQSSELFRFVANNPSTCVQFVTFTLKEKEPITMDASKTKMSRPLFPKPAEMVRHVQYFHCEGHKFGERQ